MLNEDFIKYKDSHKYNLIIGNPPFYVMKKHEAPNDYHEYFDMFTFYHFDDYLVFWASAGLNTNTNIQNYRKY